MKKDEILNALGFEFNQSAHRHTHKLTGEIEYDFSANSIEGIIVTILNAGYDNGRKDLKSEFKKLMN